MTEDAGGSGDDSFPRDEDAYWEFMDGPRDVFTCESCGSNAYRAHRGGEPGAFYAEVDGIPTVVCHECDDNYDWGTVESRIREGRRSPHCSPLGDWLDRFRGVFQPVTSRSPVLLSIHDVSPQSRASLIPETSVFLGRITTAIGLIAAVLAGVSIFAALTGALFVSPTTGVRWFSIIANVYRQWVLFLLAHPYLVLGGIGMGYFLHLVEYQRHVGETERDMGRSRPRWHYLAIFAGGGLLGWFIWVLSQGAVLGQAFLPVGVLTWSAGAFGLVYFLHEALLEDRWSYGLRMHSAVWKFPTQFAVGLMLLDGVLGLPGPDANAYAVALVPPVIGLLYAARRYAAFTEQGAEVSRRIEAVTAPLRQRVPWPTSSPIQTQAGSRETTQFGQFEAPPDEDQGRDTAGTSSLDQEQELEQTREWAEYLESELHEREEQMQDLEVRLAKVRQELEAARESVGVDEPSTAEHDDLLTDLFDIRENFQRALDAESALGEAADEGLSEGIEMIDSQIRSILEREGVEEIDTSGEVDPTKHRVVETVPVADADPGEIVDVYQLGYRLDDRIIREAQVVVASDSPDDGDAETSSESSQDNRGADGS